MAVERRSLNTRGRLDASQTEGSERGQSHLTTGVAYLKLWPIALPKVISPLSMRMLNPQSGLEQTHAL